LAKLEPNAPLQGPIKIGTRASPLAMAQAEQVRDWLAALPAFSNCTITLVSLSTRGDQILDKPLAELGGKGLFTAELDQGLRSGEIDLAVHSLKDLPTETNDDLVTIAAIPEREDPRDALIYANKPDILNASDPLQCLPHGAKIGTASLRRKAQLLALRPDLDVQTLRGNVGTRLHKLKTQGFHATLLACAGLNRLGQADEIHIQLAASLLMPAAGQGALAIECLANRPTLRDALSHIHHPQTALCVAAERSYLNALDGSCRTPIAAMASLQEGAITLSGRVLFEDGSDMAEITLRHELSADPSHAMDQAKQLGRDAADDIRAKAPKLVEQLSKG
jgi:hydroxymethylbilane synthase